MNCGSSTKLKRKNSWFFSLKLMSIRVSKELLCSNSFGESAKLERSEPTALVVGLGYKFNSAMAFGSRRPEGIMFRPQPATVKTKFAGAEPQVPKGSRTNAPEASLRVVA